MRRFILQAGAWTALGLVAAFAVVSANSSHRRPVTAAPSAKATVAAAKAAATCTSSDACCAKKASVAPATFAAVKHATKRKAATKTTQSVGVNGMVVAIDPVTGELSMPTPEQMVELQGSAQTTPSDDLNRSDVGLTEVHHPNGMTTMDLQGRFQEFAMVHKGPNGKLVLGCADAKALNTPTTQPASGALEEK
jgi:hypothetical protein